jgi:hypothetical protein
LRLAAWLPHSAYPATPTLQRADGLPCSAYPATRRWLTLQRLPCNAQMAYPAALTLQRLPCNAQMAYPAALTLQRADGLPCSAYPATRRWLTLQPRAILRSPLCRRHSRVWFCRRGAAFDTFAHESLVGNIVRGTKPLYAAFTVDQGRRVHERSRSVGPGSRVLGATTGV